MKLTCMHKELKLTFNLMFDKAWNAVILNQKTPYLEQFVQFEFWDMGRENVPMSLIIIEE